jgi:perosamine synthetase
LRAHLHDRGIGSRPIYPPLHAEPAFAREERHPVAEDMSARILWLPSSLRLTDADVDRVCAAIREFMPRSA